MQTHFHALYLLPPIHAKYVITEKKDSKLNSEFPFINYLYAKGKSGVAMYSAPDLILLKANQVYLNFLDEHITRISSGNIKLNNTAIEIVNLTKKIVGSVEVYGKQKDIEITFSSELRKKTTFIDEEKLKRILLNLLANAVKFTPKGKRIDVHLYSRKRKTRRVLCISVNDEGIGIPKDKQLYIFERFGQVGSSLSRQAEGTGLGLTLVKMMIEAMEGEILLESEPGKGSTFTVVLPLIKPVEDIPYPSPYAQSRQLYTDDSRIVRAASIEFSDIYFD